MEKKEIREHLLKTAVYNMKEFGYPHVTTENIITDEVYSMLFKNMLNDNLGVSDQIDDVINNLLQEINREKNQNK